MNPTLTEVRDRIWRLHFKSPYDLAMHFLRYQENYESPNPKFREHQFSILDFMEWYSYEYGGGSFTYPSDWSGFNVPSEVIRRVLEGGIPDENRYDEFMRSTYDSCRSRSGDKFYLIGTFGRSSAFKHEVAHGLYYVDPSYRSRMDELVDSLSKSSFRKLVKYLTKIGYAESVMVDEVQAYMATGLPRDLKDLEILNGSTAPFRKAFRAFAGKLRV